MSFVGVARIFVLLVTVLLWLMIFTLRYHDPTVCVALCFTLCSVCKIFSNSSASFTDGDVLYGDSRSFMA